jgi:endoplasmic reticulum-Golgi intermediate compartment protein 3
VSWAFGRGENVEQCEREHYGERLDEQRKEGCRIEGNLRVNKVIGNFHIAPGRSFSNGNMHVHDLNNYFDTPIEGGHTFSHKIHQLRFGPQVPEDMRKKLGSSSSAMPWTNHHLNPLDETAQETTEAAFNYMYFVKVVSTSYLPLGAKKAISNTVNTYSDSPLGSHGLNDDGSLETHQYSVTSHKRSLGGGTDAEEGHKERMHARGGIPGVFFSYVCALPLSVSPLSLLAFFREVPPVPSAMKKGSDLTDLNLAGYITHESYQSRRALQVLPGLPHRYLRRSRRHLDRSCGRR